MRLHDSRLVRSVLLASIACAWAAGPVHAQTTWQGPYVGGSAGAMFQNGDPDESIEFDTNLDDEFDDTVRTLAGADAFAPGTCAGLATSPTPTTRCKDDEDGFVLGARAGYDWMTTRGIVVGVVADLSFPEATDSVSAFSGTPASYGLTRELNSLVGLRARVGGGTERWLAYATGGLAFGWVDHTFITSNTVNTFTREHGNAADENDGASDGAAGYQLGAGLEVRIAERWTVQGEYLFTALDDRDDGAMRAAGPAPAGNPFLLVNTAGTVLRRSDWFGVHAITLGVNVRF